MNETRNRGGQPLPNSTISDKLVQWGIASSPEQASFMLLGIVAFLLVVGFGIWHFSQRPTNRAPSPQELQDMNNFRAQ